MEKQEILSHLDHTMLKQTATWKEIMETCLLAMENKVASVCIPPSYVKEAYDFVNGKMAICTVIGFPNGYQTKETKVFETMDAIKNGASEIDMVINQGFLKDGRYDKIEQEINDIKKACKGKMLKVIVETCFLTDEEKKKICEVVSASSADYIKTSTGFGSGGATARDLIIFSKNMTNNTKIKAAGGIKCIGDAENFLSIGVDRLGSSSLIKMFEK